MAMAKSKSLKTQLDEERARREEAEAKLRDLALKAEFLNQARLRYPLIGDPAMVANLVRKIALLDRSLAEDLDGLLVSVNLRLVDAYHNDSPEQASMDATREAEALAEQMVHAGEAADKYKALTMIWESRPDLYEKHIAEISR
jgi:hypothetical protein